MVPSQVEIEVHLFTETLCLISRSYTKGGFRSKSGPIYTMGAEESMTWSTIGFIEVYLHCRWEGYATILRQGRSIHHFLGTILAPSSQPLVFPTKELHTLLRRGMSSCHMFIMLTLLLIISAPTPLRVSISTNALMQTSLRPSRP